MDIQVKVIGEEYYRKLDLSNEAKFKRHEKSVIEEGEEPEDLSQHLANFIGYLHDNKHWDILTTEELILKYKKGNEIKFILTVNEIKTIIKEGENVEEKDPTNYIEIYRDGRGVVADLYMNLADKRRPTLEKVWTTYIQKHQEAPEKFGAWLARIKPVKQITQD